VRADGRAAGRRAPGIARGCAAAGVVVLVACGGAVGPVVPGRGPPLDDAALTALPGACADLYADDVLPTF
jgi:hypothetical protein